MVKKIGILTGGGDCPGLNAVIASIVRTGMNFGYEFIGFRRGFEGLLGDTDYMELNDANTRGIAHLGGTILKTTNKGNFAAKVGTGNKKEVDEKVMDEAIANLEKLGVDCLVVIGGDGSLSTALQFQERGLPIIGVPKTIDNDLRETDRTFGFHTGVSVISDCLQKIHPTAVSHDRVFFVETMGRNVGWLTLFGGIAGGAHMILIPEIPYSYKAILNFLRDRYSSNHPFAVVAVAEGARASDEEIAVAKVKSSGEYTLGGAAARVAANIEAMASDEFEVKVSVLGHLQRGGFPTPTDRILSQRFGFGAIQAINKGEFGKMVALKGSEITTVPIQDAVADLKYVELESDVVAMAKAYGISFGE